MTYRRDSDLPFLYGGFEPTRPHPTDPSELDSHIKRFGRENTHLAKKKGKSKEPRVAWFVSNCQTHGEREKYVEALKQHVQVRGERITQPFVKYLAIFLGQIVAR